MAAHIASSCDGTRHSTCNTSRHASAASWWSSESNSLLCTTPLMSCRHRRTMLCSVNRSSDVQRAASFKKMPRCAVRMASCAWRLCAHRSVPQRRGANQHHRDVTQSDSIRSSCNTVTTLRQTVHEPSREHSMQQHTNPSQDTHMLTEVHGFMHESSGYQRVSLTMGWDGWSDRE